MAFTMDEQRKLLRHFPAALAYRTQKALRGAPDDFGDFRAREGVRTPSELLRHMTSVLGYARTFFIGGRYWPETLSTFDEEIARFHDMLESLAGQIGGDSAWNCRLTPDQLLQGPLADAMTHAGQLALLRRLAASPVAPENFIFAEIDGDSLGPDQAEPACPDQVWPEAPEGWTPSAGRSKS